MKASLTFVLAFAIVFASAQAFNLPEWDWVGDFFENSPWPEFLEKFNENFRALVDKQLTNFLEGLEKAQSYFSLRLKLLLDQQKRQFLTKIVERLDNLKTNLETLPKKLEDVRNRIDGTRYTTKQAILDSWQLWIDAQLEEVKKEDNSTDTLDVVSSILQQYQEEYEKRLNECSAEYENLLADHETHVHEFLNETTIFLNDFIGDIQYCMQGVTFKECMVQLGANLKHFDEVDSQLKALFEENQQLLDKKIENYQCSVKTIEDFENNKPKLEFSSDEDDDEPQIIEAESISEEETHVIAKRKVAIANEQLANDDGCVTVVQPNGTVIKVC